MNIIKSSENLTPVQLYKLAIGNNSCSMRDLVGQRLEITAYAIYEDVNNKGEPQQILAVMTPEGKVFTTNSETFMREFKRMNDFFGEYGMDVSAVNVTSGTSKSGRSFISCEYAD